MNLRADIGIRFLPTAEPFPSPAIQALQVLGREFDEFASLGLFQSYSEQRTQVLQTIALIKEAQCFPYPSLALL